MRLNFPLGYERASFSSSTRSWPNKAENTGQAAASLWEEMKHQLWMSKSSGMNQQVGWWHQELLLMLYWSCQRYSVAMEGKIGNSLIMLSKMCEWLFYTHRTGIVPLHWATLHRATKPAIKTALNCSQCMETNFHAVRLRTDMRPLPTPFHCHWLLGDHKQVISLLFSSSSFVGRLYDTGVPTEDAFKFEVENMVRVRHWCCCVHSNLRIWYSASVSWINQH